MRFSRSSGSRPLHLSSANPRIPSLPSFQADYLKQRGGIRMLLDNLFFRWWGQI